MTRPYMGLARLVMAATIGAGASGAAAAGPIRYVDAEAAAAMIREGVVALDVRTDEEWAEGHVDGAVHLPLSALPDGLDALGLDRERPVLVYCRSGNRAGKAAEIMAERGFADIRVLKPGGFSELQQAGLPTRTGP